MFTFNLADRKYRNVTMEEMHEIFKEEDAHEDKKSSR